MWNHLPTSLHGSLRISLFPKSEIVIGHLLTIRECIFLELFTSRSNDTVKHRSAKDTIHIVFVFFSFVKQYICTIFVKF